jgi:hypothetical protein
LDGSANANIPFFPPWGPKVPRNILQCTGRDIFWEKRCWLGSLRGGAKSAPGVCLSSPNKSVALGRPWTVGKGRSRVEGSGPSRVCHR